MEVGEKPTRSGNKKWIIGKAWISYRRSYWGMGISFIEMKIQFLKGKKQVPARLLASQVDYIACSNCIRCCTMSYEFADAHKIKDQSAMHYLKFEIMGGIDIFSHKIYRDIVLDSMQFCRRNKNLKIGAFSVMSNEIPTIWTAGNNNLSDIIRDFKTFTSKEITKAIQKEYRSRRDWLLYMFNFYANRTNANDYFKVWTGDNHPEEIHDDAHLRAVLFQIHQSPVEAGLVSEPTHYLYSSARDFSGLNGIMEIDPPTPSPQAIK
jgi:hypothetical protein